MPQGNPAALNPKRIPAQPAADGLPPVPPDRLTPDLLRLRFSRPPVWQPEPPLGVTLVDRAPACASVLVPLVMRERLTVLLTRRNDGLRDHAGQISFPGGRAEPYDADAAATALREAAEEIGLSEDRVEVIGSLPVYATVSAYLVTPVVALVRPGFALRMDPGEVTEVFEVPLDYLMQPEHHYRHFFEESGQCGQFFSMPWQSGEGKCYFIWGATAAMLRNLYRFLAA